MYTYCHNRVWIQCLKSVFCIGFTENGSILMSLLNISLSFVTAWCFHWQLFVLFLSSHMSYSRVIRECRGTFVCNLEIMMMSECIIALFTRSFHNRCHTYKEKVCMLICVYVCSCVLDCRPTTSLSIVISLGQICPLIHIQLSPHYLQPRPPPNEFKGNRGCIWRGVFCRDGGWMVGQWYWRLGDKFPKSVRSGVIALCESTCQNHLEKTMERMTERRGNKKREGDKEIKGEGCYSILMSVCVSVIGC